MKSTICLRICFILIIPDYYFCTGITRNDSCIDGCMIHRMAGIVLPLYESSHDIYIWQNGSHSDMGLSVEGNILYVLGENNWTNIYTNPDGRVCVIYQHTEKMWCSYQQNELFIQADSGSLWKLDCIGSSCGCNQHLLIALTFGPKDLPVRVFLKPNKTARQLWFTFETNVKGIQLRWQPKWYDITIAYEFNNTEGGRYVVNSESLDMRYTTSNTSSSLSIFASTEDRPIPSLIALGCSEYPNLIPPQYIEGEMHKPTTITAWLVPLIILIVVIVTICKKRARLRTAAAASTDGARNVVAEETRL